MDLDRAPVRADVARIAGVRTLATRRTRTLGVISFNTTLYAT
ncbi:hypothetical protein ACFYZ2_08650 [Streptomyces sviceus]